MKKAILAFVILFVIVGQSVCYSEGTSKRYKTVGLYNGRAWSEMSEDAKFTFVAGIHNGAAYFRDVIIGRGANPKMVNEAFDSLMHIPKTSYDEIAKQIDSFYVDSTNLNIPINRAYEIVNYKIRGEPPSKLEEYTAEFRKFYNK